MRPRQPEGHVHVLEGLQGDVDLLAELGERAVGAGEPSCSAVATASSGSIRIPQTGSVTMAMTCSFSCRGSTLPRPTKRTSPEGGPIRLPLAYAVARDGEGTA